MNKTYASALDDLLSEIYDVDKEYHPDDVWSKTKFDQFDSDKTWNHFIDIEEKIKKRYSLSDHDYSIILDKLFEDKLIGEHEPPPKSGDPGQEVLGKSFYYITFKGLEFYLEGGYTKQRKNEQLNKVNLRLINFALIFGGVAAGFYYTAIGIKWIWHYLLCHCL